MADRTFRNHVSMLVDNLISWIVMSAVLFASTFDAAGVLWASVVSILLFALGMGASVFIWRKTTVTFTDTEIITRKDTKVFKSEKRIQYTRLASVNVRRSIVNQLMGTTKLLFNVNSSVNANSSEASLTLNAELAEQIRNELNSMIFRKEMTVEEEKDIDSLVEVSSMEVIVHALIAQPTSRALFALIMLIYSIASLLMGSTGGLLTGAIMLLVSEIVPFISDIFRYHGYRLYRIGDTITVESGLITTRRTSFKISRINSLRVREPLLARFFGMSTLEAEVVGLVSEGDDSDTSPLLCPLKKKAVVDDLMRELMPEVVFESQPEHQPRSAVITKSVAGLSVSLIVSAVLVASYFYVIGEHGGVLPFIDVTIALVFLGSAVAVPLLVIGHVILAQKGREFDMGSESFMFRYGGYDLAREFILYDKVQYVTVTSGPLERHYGLAKCEVKMMSSTGFKGIESGLFPQDDMEKVSAEVMARIRDGRYDYRRYLRWPPRSLS